MSMLAALATVVFASMVGGAVGAILQRVFPWLLPRPWRWYRVSAQVTRYGRPAREIVYVQATDARRAAKEAERECWKNRCEGYVFQEIYEEDPRALVIPSRWSGRILLGR